MSFSTSGINRLKNAVQRVKSANSKGRFCVNVGISGIYEFHPTREFAEDPNVFSLNPKKVKTTRMSDAKIGAKALCRSNRRFIDMP